MPSTVPKRKRRIRLILGIAAVAAFATIPMSDRTVHRSARTAASAPRGQASTYFIDPATGLQREPTPEELLALQQQSLQAAEAPQPFTTDNGFTGLRLSDDQMMFTVATKNADGTVTISHAPGRKEAERQVKQAAERGMTAGKEQRLER